MEEPKKEAAEVEQPSEIASLEAAKLSLLRRLALSGAVEVKEIQIIVKALADVNTMLEKLTPQEPLTMTLDEQFQVFKEQFWGQLSPVDKQRYIAQL